MFDRCGRVADDSAVSGFSHGEEPPTTRKRRWAKRLLWVLAVLACLGGVSLLVQTATFPRAVADHPVRTEATITQVYINGLGGDPAVDYEYRVGGRKFTGSGNGKLGNEALLSLHPGDRVAVEYASGAPSESCTCDAAREAPPSLMASILIAASLTLPVAVLLWRRVPRWAASRRSWFVPVRGLGEWIGFLAGILVVIPVGVIALAYFFAPSVWP